MKNSGKSSERNHSRAPGIIQTSIAIPNTLLVKIQKIADAEVRSRNAQIHFILDEFVKAYGKPKARRN